LTLIKDVVREKFFLIYLKPKELKIENFNN